MAAERAGWAVDDPSVEFLRALDGELQARARPDVAVMSRSRGRRLGDILEETFPDATIVRVDAAAPDTHVALAARGPFDVIVDVTTRDGLKRFRQLFGHLRTGGVLVLRVPIYAGGPAGSKGRGRDLQSYVSRLLERQRREPDMPDAARQVRDAELVLAHSVGPVTSDSGHVSVQCAVGLLAKLREDEMNEVIELRSSTGARVVHRHEPGHIKACPLRENRPQHNPRMKPSYRTPPISLREYDDVTCVPGQVAVQGSLLLPDSYRHNQQNRLNNRFTEDATPLFARVIADISEPRYLRGTYYYLDNELRGHFGHTMTEQMSKLWALSDALETYPDLRGLVSCPAGRGAVSATERTIFRAAGLAEDRIEAFSEPVLVERLVAPTPMFSMPAYAHPEIRQTWARVSRALAADAPDRPYPRRVFSSRRRQDKRVCHNAGEVEALFSQHGFEVLYPEDYSLPEQVGIFRAAEVVAGFAGSNLFQLSLCETPKRVIMITSESYTATNEYLISCVLGHSMDIVWCPPDVPQPKGGWRNEAFRSGFTFDRARDGDWLRDVMR